MMYCITSRNHFWNLIYFIFQKCKITVLRLHSSNISITYLYHSKPKTLKKIRPEKIDATQQNQTTALMIYFDSREISIFVYSS